MHFPWNESDPHQLLTSELSLQIVRTVAFESPLSLCRARAVCKNWRMFIDGPIVRRTWKELFLDTMTNVDRYCETDTLESRILQYTIHNHRLLYMQTMSDWATRLRKCCPDYQRNRLSLDQLTQIKARSLARVWHSSIQRSTADMPRSSSMVRVTVSATECYPRIDLREASCIAWNPSPQTARALKQFHLYQCNSQALLTDFLEHEMCADADSDSDVPLLERLEYIPRRFLTEIDIELDKLHKESREPAKTVLVLSDSDSEQN